MSIVTAKDIRPELPEAAQRILRKFDGYTVTVKEYAALIDRTYETALERVKFGEDNIRHRRDRRSIRLLKEDVVVYIKKMYPQAEGV